MYCEDCGKKGSVIRSNVTGNVYRCSECDAKAEEKYGIKRFVEFGFPRTKSEFKPYTLKDGPIWSLPKDWPGLDFKNREVRIESEQHRKATLDRMGCRALERGEVVDGHKAYLRGQTHRLYSFLGNRKANTCH